MANVKVLVCDDSPIMQKLLVSMLAGDNRLQVVGLAANGLDCIQKAVQLKPQVILLDLEMPMMDGVDTLAELSRRNLDVAVLIVCDFHQKESPQLKSALEAGAFDFFVKPKSTMEIDRYQRQVLTKIFVASFTKTKQIPKKGEVAQPTPIEVTRPRSRKYTVIGCSTAGKHSLSALLPHLTDKCTTAIVIVIQQPAFIVNQFLKEIASSSKLPIGQASDGAAVVAKQVLIAPSGAKDIEIVADAGSDPPGFKLRYVEPSDAPNHPSLDVLFRSASAAFGPDVMGIVLSGTTKDGVEGLKAIRAAKGITVAEDKATATVSQLPLEAVQAGAADEVLPIQGIAERLNS